jgi:hypothetical protein
MQQTQALAESHQHLTLAQASHIAPGRPSVNCLWRWARRGVVARNGERIKLQHIRVGGRIYTSREWLDEFGRLLAEADAAHFDRFHDSGNVSQTDRSRQEHIAQVEHELNEAGL